MQREVHVAFPVEGLAAALADVGIYIDSHVE